MFHLKRINDSQYAIKIICTKCNIVKEYKTDILNLYPTIQADWASSWICTSCNKGEPT